jgi:hypothetical protein
MLVKSVFGTYENPAVCNDHRGFAAGREQRLGDRLRCRDVRER